MLDLKLIRSEPERVRAALERRGDASALEIVIELDARARKLRPDVERLRSENAARARTIGEARKAGNWANPTEEDAARMFRGVIADQEVDLRTLEEDREQWLLTLPNLAEDAAPDGGEDDAIELRRVGATDAPAFPIRDHVDLGASLGVIDLERAARTSGARFVYLMGGLVRVQLALVTYVLDLLEGEGFTPVVPPVLVRESAMYGTGFFPTDRASIYETAADDLFLVGTSEVPLAALHQDEILDEGALPLRYAGMSTCFRREAGAAGKDTRGMFRVHQFDKVEMFSFTRPADSPAEHEHILALEERILASLEIPYRVVDVAVGDLGASAARKFDCEAWMPGQGRYREVTSCSNCTDYQARRLRARYRSGKDTQPVHTLNGTAVAVGRTLIAILENHQRADGSVAIPSVLHSFGAPPELRPRI